MGIVSGIVVFVMIWWTVIFCVLPLGLSTQYEEQGEHIASGAPSKLDMKKKFLLTTLISIVLWVIVFLLIYFEVFSFRDWANAS